MSELWQLGAVRLAAMIRSGATSASEVLEAHLDRIEQVNGSLNAVVRVMADEARAAADEADQAVAGGGPLGVLHGVPCTIKENVDLAGTPTTQGLSILAGAIADRDAPVVERLRRAGAIPFARTNLPDLGLRVHTDSDLHGLTRNPWHAGRTAGGSSGGEASAIASGMSPLGIGNDIGGSLRNPAHCCGIASLKPTTGVIPRATVVEPIEPLLSSQLMLVEGPMAREVADLRAALGVLAVPDRRDPLSLPVTLTAPEPDARFPIAILPEPPGGRTHPEIADAVRRAGALLHAAGHEVREITPPDYEATLMLWAGMLLSDLRPQMPLLEAVMGPGGRSMLALFDAGAPQLDAAGVSAQYAQRHALMRSWSAFFEQTPILLTPTWALPAFEHGSDLVDPVATLETFRPVLPANLLGLPAAVVPAGFADGLPVGVQIIGDRFADLWCLEIAERLEDGLGRLTPIDPRER